MCHALDAPRIFYRYQPAQLSVEMTVASFEKVSVSGVGRANRICAETLAGSTKDLSRNEIGSCRCCVLENYRSRVRKENSRGDRKIRKIKDEKLCFIVLCGKSVSFISSSRAMFVVTLFLYGELSFCKWPTLSFSLSSQPIH